VFLKELKITLFARTVTECSTWNGVEFSTHSNLWNSRRAARVKEIWTLLTLFPVFPCWLNSMKNQFSCLSSVKLLHFIKPIKTSGFCSEERYIISQSRQISLQVEGNKRQVFIDNTRRKIRFTNFLLFSGQRNKSGTLKPINLYLFSSLSHASWKPLLERDR
jgi:hypothetical protein